MQTRRIDIKLPTNYNKIMEREEFLTEMQNRAYIVAGVPAKIIKTIKE